jgi:hypothetical protein
MKYTYFYVAPFRGHIEGMTADGIVQQSGGMTLAEYLNHYDLPEVVEMSREELDKLQGHCDSIVTDKFARFSLNDSMISTVVEFIKHKKLDYIETSQTGNDITVCVQGHYLYNKFHGRG